VDAEDKIASFQLNLQQRNMDAEIDSAASSQQIAESQAKFEKDDADIELKKYNFNRLRRDAQNKSSFTKRDSFLKTDGSLNYLAQMAALKRVFTVNLDAVLWRIGIAAHGFKVLYGLAIPELPANMTFAQEGRLLQAIEMPPTIKGDG
jgi:hypothetical protein